MSRTPLSVLLACLVIAEGGARARPTSGPTLAGLDALYPELETLYVDLHRSPELSLREVETAAKMAERLRALGFDVTTGVGGTGVVGVLRNGKGPAVMLRTDLDALPIEEKTGLAYASKVTVVDAGGATVPVMHACGHDLHMTVWVGTATLLSKARSRWRGTLIMVGQPAEEKGAGARMMLADGLFERFPKPDYALAIHNDAGMPAGKVGWVAGHAFANVDTVDVVIYGKGGHGAYPQNAIDPVVIAARTVVALQTIVARENNPLDPAVITVGSIHGGTKHNIIPEEVKLELTVRSYKEDVRARLLAAIARVVKAEAAAAAAPKEPLVEHHQGESIGALYNDPALTKRLVEALGRGLGAARLEERPPVMGGEDFGEYGRAGVPLTMFWVGAVDPKTYADAKAANRALPSNHSALFAPAPAPTIKTGIETLTLAALELFGK